MYKWRRFQLKRLNGLNLKMNVIDVQDGRSLDLKNTFQNQSGVASKRPGTEVMFDTDEDGTSAIAEVGACTLSSNKYYFKFVDGDFRYSITRTGATTNISPSPAIDTANLIWTAVLDDKLFFVDGTNRLRYFDGSSIKDSTIYARPTAAPTSASGAGAFTYVYTVDNGLGESPAVITPLPSIISAGTIRVPGNTGPQTLIAGDIVNIYSRADTVAAASKLVASYTWQAADVIAGHSDIVTVAISDAQSQLYTELGLAVNKSAPIGLVGIISHYGRLVGWRGSSVYDAKVSNPHAWPDDTAIHEAFVYGFGVGDGEDITRCASFRESLYVMKPSNIAVFGGTGPDDTGGNAYSFRRLETNGKGCIGPKSVQVIGEKSSNYLIYLSRTGFMATDGSRPVEIGADIELVIRALGDGTKQDAISVYDIRLGLYLCFLGGPTSKTCWAFDVRPDESQFVGWWKWSEVNAVCISWDIDRYLYGTTNGMCGSQRISGTANDFSDVRQEYIQTSAVNATTNRLTVATAYATADPLVVRSTGAVPGGLSANTTYYAIVISSTVIKLATTAANAALGTAIDIIDVGSGVHSLVSAQAIDGYYTTNWLHFGSPTLVKKLSKPGFVFNAVAASINLTVSVAYDWVPQFGTPKVIVLGSQDLWGAEPYGGFSWGAGANASPKNFPLARRKCRSIRYKFQNSVINQDFNLLGMEQFYDAFRNRGNYPA